jgi:hypothetical protein
MFDGDQNALANFCKRFCCCDGQFAGASVIVDDEYWRKGVRDR